MLNRKSRKRTSLIFTLPKEEMQKLVNESYSITDVLRKLNLGITGSSHGILKKRLIYDSISLNFKKDETTINLRNNLLSSREEALSSLFIAKEQTSSTLRKYILLYNLIPYCCAQCGINDEWNGQKLCLQIDHIDGDRSNNKIDNLRFLCPNCHSQTKTFGTRNRKAKDKKRHLCSFCKKEKSNSSAERCSSCHLSYVTKIQTNLLNLNLSELVFQKQIKDIAIENNCSENSVRKICKKQGIKVPPKGYWIRRKFGKSHEEALISKPIVTIRKKRFTEEQVAQIKSLLTSSLSLRQIAAKFNVTHHTIANIRDGNTYTNEYFEDLKKMTDSN